MKPLFMVLEGIDGTGKSTQAKMLNDWFVSNGHPILFTREPGSEFEKNCVDIQDMIYRPGLSKKARLFGYMYDRAEHFDKIVRPALDKGLNIVCDRCYASTIAYQGAGANIPLDILQTLNDFTVDPKPDLEILYDLKPETAMERVLKTNIYDHQSLQFFQRVRTGYLNQKQLKVITINDKSVEQVFEETLFLVKRVLKEKSNES